LFDEEKEREILGKMSKEREQQLRKILRFAFMVGLNVIVFFGAWLLCLV
jgi:hypothetical protein